MSLQIAANRFASTYASNLIGTALVAVALLVGVKVMMPANDAQASIIQIDSECGKEGAPAAICADGNLRALADETNAAITKAAALYRHNAAARNELKALVPQLAGMRTYAAGDGGVGLPKLMHGQLEFLNSLDRPRGDYAGRWISPMGEIVIGKAPNGAYAQIKVAEPTSNAWACKATSNAKIKNGGLLFAEGDHSSSESSLEGWTIQMKRDGALLRVIEIPPSGAGDAHKPYCEAGGGFEGLYFPAK